MEAKLVDIVVVAMQLNPDNIEEFEKFCGGQVKGTKLPIAKRVVDFYDHNGIEQRVEMTDWVISLADAGGLRVRLTDARRRELFQ